MSEDTYDYATFPKRIEDARQSLLNDPGRFQAISEREDKSDTPMAATKAHCKGRFFVHHRGSLVMKTPNDQVVFKELLTHVRPATVIELGSFTGANALWVADTLNLEGISCSVYSMDIDLGLLQDKVKEIKPDSLTFLQGDSNRIAETFTAEFLKDLPHPWIVNEDATHENIFGVLEHFVGYMKMGDYFVVEDTNPEIPIHIGAATAVHPEYVPTGTAKKLDVLKRFLAKYKKECAVDSYFTDFFGYNGTWSWHGYVRRM